MSLKTLLKIKTNNVISLLNIYLYKIKPIFRKAFFVLSYMLLVLQKQSDFYKCSRYQGGHHLPQECEITRVTKHPCKQARELVL